MPGHWTWHVIDTKHIFYWIWLYIAFATESEVASGTFLFIRLTRMKLLNGTNDGSTFKSTSFVARWSWKQTMKCGKSGGVKTTPWSCFKEQQLPQLLKFCFSPLNEESWEGQKGYWSCSLIFFQELPHVTRLPPGTSAVWLSSLCPREAKMLNWWSLLDLTEKFFTSGLDV